MTKETMLKKIDNLISKEEALIKEYNKVILECSDSPRITSSLGFMHEGSVRHLSDLQELRKTIESYDEDKEQATKMFNSYYGPTPVEAIGGITFSEDKGEE